MLPPTYGNGNNKDKMEEMIGERRGLTVLGIEFNSRVHLKTRRISGPLEDTISTAKRVKY
jgi:hypothetical protein